MLALYLQYFEQEKHPSSKETLMKACLDAGISEEEATPVVEAQDEGLQDVKMQIREQAGNGVDAVPYVSVEGKRRDITILVRLRCHCKGGCFADLCLTGREGSA